MGFQRGDASSIWVVNPPNQFALFIQFSYKSQFLSLVCCSGVSPAGLSGLKADRYRILSWEAWEAQVYPQQER